MKFKMTAVLCCLMVIQCSIDALLERTIRHMLFLQSVKKHADNLKQSGESKVRVSLILAIFMNLNMFLNCSCYCLPKIDC